MTDTKLIDKIIMFVVHLAYWLIVAFCVSAILIVIIR